MIPNLRELTEVSNSPGCPPGDVAQQRRLPGLGDAGPFQPPAGVHPPAEPPTEPEPLQEKQRPGPGRVLPPRQALFLCGHAAFGEDLQPGQAGNDQKAPSQLQVDL